MSFEEAKQYLRGKDEEGASLYEHLSRLLLKIIVEKPHNANAVLNSYLKTSERSLSTLPHC